MDAIAANYALVLLAPLKRNKEGISENSGHKTILDLVDLLKAKQTEINQLQSQINEMAEVGLSQESAIREKDKRVEAALFQMRQQALSLKEDCDGYKDPVGICQSEGVDWCVRFLEKALQGFQGDRS